jgi:hypothetical protein
MPVAPEMSNPTTSLRSVPMGPMVVRTPLLAGLCRASTSRPVSMTNSWVDVAPAKLLVYAAPTMLGLTPKLASPAA